MNVQNTSQMEISKSQFSEVHGDQNIHRHAQSVQVDGQNNTAILHEDRRGTLDNQIINENCNNMVVFGQGQNCQVTLDSVDLSFLRNRIGKRTLQNSSNPFRNECRIGMPPRGAQNNTGTEINSNVSYQGYNNTFIDKNNGLVTIIGQGINNEAQSCVGSPRPHPPPTSLQSSENFPSSSRQRLPVRTVQEKTGHTLASVRNGSSGQLEIMASSSLSASNQGGCTVNETATRSKPSVPATTALKQHDTNGNSGFSSLPPGAPFPLEAASMTSLEGPQSDTREREPVLSSSEVRGTPADQMRQESIAKSGTGAPRLANKMHPHTMDGRMARGADTCSTTEMVSQENMGMPAVCAKGAPNPDQKSKHFAQRILWVFKGWKNGKKKTSL